MYFCNERMMVDKSRELHHYWISAPLPSRDYITVLVCALVVTYQYRPSGFM
jgi:hypothetical protein